MLTIWISLLVFLALLIGHAIGMARPKVTYMPPISGEKQLDIAAHEALYLMARKLQDKQPTVFGVTFPFEECSYMKAGCSGPGWIVDRFDEEIEGVFLPIDSLDKFEIAAEKLIARLQREDIIGFCSQPNIAGLDYCKSIRDQQSGVSLWLASDYDIRQNDIPTILRVVVKLRR